MIIRDCMKRNVISIPPQASVAQAAARMKARHIGTLPVVDSTGKLVGVLQLRDLLALVMPDFIRLMEDFDFVHDFGVLESRQPSGESLARPVQEIMQPPVSVEETSGLLRAAAILYQENLSDLLVVTVDRRLVGIASRVDIGMALLSSWQTPQESEAP